MILSVTLVVTFFNFQENPIISLLVLAFYAFTILFYIVANFAIQIKRFHDRNKSGWWIFLHFIPAIGGIWALIELGFLKGTPGPNRFGADPTYPD